MWGSDNNSLTMVSLNRFNQSAEVFDTYTPPTVQTDTAYLHSTRFKFTIQHPANTMVLSLNELRRTTYEMFIVKPTQKFAAASIYDEYLDLTDGLHFVRNLGEITLNPEYLKTILYRKFAVGVDLLGTVASYYPVGDGVMRKSMNILLPRKRRVHAPTGLPWKQLARFPEQTANMYVLFFSDETRQSESAQFLHFSVIHRITSTAI